MLVNLFTNDWVANDFATVIENMKALDDGYQLFTKLPDSFHYADLELSITHAGYGERDGFHFTGTVDGACIVLCPEINGIYLMGGRLALSDLLSKDCPSLVTILEKEDWHEAFSDVGYVSRDNINGTKCPPLMHPLEYVSGNRH